MLTMPELYIDSCSIMGLDPGSTKFGVGIIEIDPVDLTIENVSARTLLPGRFTRNDPYAVSHSDFAARLEVLAKMLTRSLFVHRPFSIGYEAPFYYRKTVSAYGPLCDVRSMVRREICAFDSRLPFHQFEPSVVKASVGVQNVNKKRKDKDNKTPVKDAIRKIDEIMDNFEGPIPFEFLDDNAIDGIAVGYCLLQQLRSENVYAH